MLLILAEESMQNYSSFCHLPCSLYNVKKRIRKEREWEDIIISCFNSTYIFKSFPFWGRGNLISWDYTVIKVSGCSILPFVIQWISMTGWTSLSMMAKDNVSVMKTQQVKWPTVKEVDFAPLNYVLKWNVINCVWQRIKINIKYYTTKIKQAFNDISD